MSKYDEDIYGRKEFQALTLQGQIDYLSGFENPARGENEFTKNAVELRDELILSSTIKEQVPNAGLVLIDKLETQANEITRTRIKRETLSSIRERKSQLEKQIESESKNIEKEFKSQIKSAETPEEVTQILNKTDSPTIPQKTRNKIKDEADRKIKEIRQARARELEKEQKAAKAERLKREKAEREAEKDRKTEEFEARRAEANRIREERQAEIAREKEQREEELLKEALKEERKIANEIAREQARGEA